MTNKQLIEGLRHHFAEAAMNMIGVVTIRGQS